MQNRNSMIFILICSMLLGSSAYHLKLVIEKEEAQNYALDRDTKYNDKLSRKNVDNEHEEEEETLKGVSIWQKLIILLSESFYKSRYFVEIKMSLLYSDELIVIDGPENYQVKLSGIIL